MSRYFRKVRARRRFRRRRCRRRRSCHKDCRRNQISARRLDTLHRWRFGNYRERVPSTLRPRRRLIRRRCRSHLRRRHGRAKQIALVVEDKASPRHISVRTPRNCREHSLCSRFLKASARRRYRSRMYLLDCGAIDIALLVPNEVSKIGRCPSVPEPKSWRSFTVQ